MKNQKHRWNGPSCYMPDFGKIEICSKCGTKRMHGQTMMPWYGHKSGVDEIDWKPYAPQCVEENL